MTFKFDENKSICENFEDAIDDGMIEGIKWGFIIGIVVFASILGWWIWKWLQ